MKIAFVGKGGSGKTTLSATVGMIAQDYFKRSMFIDADINMHLRDAMGVSKMYPFKDLFQKMERAIREKRADLLPLKSLPRTLPPLSSGDMFKIDSSNSPYADFFEHGKQSKAFFSLGTYNPETIGWSCHHNNLGHLELVLNHTIDTNQDLILADLTAGADAFGVGLLSLFDLVFCVVEPTKKSTETYSQIKGLSQIEKVNLTPIFNKVIDDSDISYIKSRIDVDDYYVMTMSNYVRKLERDENVSILDLEEVNLHELQRLIRDIQSIKPNWQRFASALIKNHKRVIEKWPSNKFSCDLTTLMNPDLDLNNLNEL